MDSETPGEAASTGFSISKALSLDCTGLVRVHVSDVTFKSSPIVAIAGLAPRGSGYRNRLTPTDERRCSRALDLLVRRN